MGELYAGRGVHEQGDGQMILNHWLEINEIHLALRRHNLLVRWTDPESEIRSQNDLTTFGYAKDYDAIVTVKCAGADCRFALEYERSVKTRSKYEDICRDLDGEFPRQHLAVSVAHLSRAVLHEAMFCAAEAGHLFCDCGRVCRAVTRYACHRGRKARPPRAI